MVRDNLLKRVDNFETLTGEILNNYLINYRQNSEFSLIILLTGHIGAGKNYTAKELSNHLLDLGFTVQLTSFSSTLKQYTLRLFGLLKNGVHIYRDFYNYNEYKKLKDDLRNYLIEYCNIQDKKEIETRLRNFDKELGELIRISKEMLNETKNYKTVIRFILQRFGTEVIRDTIDKDFWVKQVFIKTYLKYPFKNFPNFVIIPDFRFPNELEFFKKKKYLELVEKSTFSKFIKQYELENSISTLSIRVVSPKDVILKRLNIDENTYNTWLNHISEKYIDNLSVDLEFENT
jgi:tRNA A37 threonylcarbamoyladenosine biosynthesis protein TsaE